MGLKLEPEVQEHLIALIREDPGMSAKQLVERCPVALSTAHTYRKKYQQLKLPGDMTHRRALAMAWK